MQYLDKLIKVILPFTSTGYLYISPLLSVLGVISSYRFILNRSVFRVEFYLALFLLYVIVSTALYDPMSFLKFHYYRYDGNVWVSLTPVFIGFALKKYIDPMYIERMVFVIAVIYFILLIYWLYTKNCSFGGMCSFPGLFVARNATGGFLSIMAMISFVFFIKGRKKQFFVFIVLVACLIFTISRGSMLGLILAIMVYYVYIKTKILLDVAVFFILFVSVVSVAIYFYSPSYDYSSYGSVISNFQTERMDVKSQNIISRAVYLWPKSIDLFVQSPFYGVGFGAYNDYFLNGMFVYDASHAHNTFLHVLAEQGLFGLIILLMFVWAFRVLWKKWRCMHPLISDISYFSFLVVLFASFTEHRLFAPASMILVSTLIGIFIANIRIKKKINENCYYS